MSNVVFVDFARVRASERQEYVNILREELDEGDFADVVEAVNNIELYQSLDRDLQDLVDGYLACRS